MTKYTIDEFKAAYPNDDACLDKLFQIRFNNLVCPKCESVKPYTRVNNRRSYQCPSCSHQIYPTKDTIFEKTTTPLTYWFLAIYLQTTTRNGVAAKELERVMDICYHTALRMAHQIKRLMADNSQKQLTGTVELDETLIGMQVQNMSNSKRAKIAESNKIKGKKDAISNKTIVLGMVERDGRRIITKIIPAATKQIVIPIITENVEYASQIMTDSAKIYYDLRSDYHHSSVNHEASEYARGKVHSNTIEAYWSQLKRTIKGTHIHVSAKYLPLYMDEVAYRWANKDRQKDMFELILSRVAS